MKVINRKSTKSKRQALRKEQTEAEKKLWSRLRNKSFHELKIFRQSGIGNYIADFYCPSQKLVIEVDGSQHFEQNQGYDILRSAYFNELGIRVVRFNNIDVLMNIDEVLQYLYSFIYEPENMLEKN